MAGQVTSAHRRAVREGTSDIATATIRGRVQRYTEIRHHGIAVPLSSRARLHLTRPRGARSVCRARNAAPAAVRRSVRRRLASRSGIQRAIGVAIIAASDLASTGPAFGTRIGDFRVGAGVPAAAAVRYVCVRIHTGAATTNLACAAGRARAAHARSAHASVRCGNRTSLRRA